MKCLRESVGCGKAEGRTLGNPFNRGADVQEEKKIGLAEGAGGIQGRRRRTREPWKLGKESILKRKRSSVFGVTKSKIEVGCKLPHQAS